MSLIVISYCLNSLKISYENGLCSCGYFIKDGISFIGIVSYMLYLDWRLTLVFFYWPHYLLTISR